MLKRGSYALLLAVLLAILALPVLAAQGGTGGVHFGPYTLAAEDSVTGDLVVFGPVTLNRYSELDGDLAAFGEVTIKEGATITGDLVVFGASDIDGNVEGNVFAAGAIHLRDDAYVEGDVAAVGQVARDEGAVVKGTIEPMENMESLEWEFPFVGPVVVNPGARDFPVVIEPGRPMWMNVFWKMVQGFTTIIVMSLFAALIAGIWPQHVNRVEQTIVDAPAPSFGVGLLALVIAGIVIAVLAITICLSPFALIGAIIAGLGLALGWVALGSLLGARLLQSLFKTNTFTPAGAAVFGTALLTTLAVLINLTADCLFTILIIPLFAVVGGAVVLTRFGTMPYLATGASTRRSVAPQAGSDQTPKVPESLLAPQPATGEPASAEGIVDEIAGEDASDPPGAPEEL
ncbi:MAG: polymer-forming cytoskeletal protein [Anaerolineae bacterium]|nr:polymer-forming cytoskeletal protein [Anaerolineae bacterium]